MKVTLKNTIGILKYNGKEYGPGDKVEMTKDEASKIAHHIEQAEELAEKRSEGNDSGKNSEGSDKK